MRLMAGQRRKVRDAIAGAFTDIAQFGGPFSFAFGKPLAKTVSVTDFNSTILAAMDYALTIDQGLCRLLQECRYENPENSALRDLSNEICGDDGSARGLEAVLVPGTAPQDVAAWRENMARRELAVCRIEVPDSDPARQGIGTGFLITDDLVLTNHHVAFESAASRGYGPEKLICRFDFKIASDGRQINSGVSYGLSKTAGVAAASAVNELDFAVLRLDTKAGQEPVGGNSDRAPSRGFVPPTTHQPKVGEPISIIQHPSASPLKFAFGTVTSLRSPQLVDYNASTEPGSSGSPCFSLTWELLALHRSGTQAANGGVLWAAIAADLHARNLLA